MIGKKILNRDRQLQGDTAWLKCCWDDCERPAVSLHKVLKHEHAKGLPCNSPMSKHPWFTFCSEKHRQYFIHSHIAHGRLPTGEHGRLL